jgi:hypothetical protein
MHRKEGNVLHGRAGCFPGAAGETCEEDEAMFKRLRKLMDRLVTRWLDEVIDLGEPQQPSLWLAGPLPSNFRFRVLTPAMQHQLDQFA